MKTRLVSIVIMGLMLVISVILIIDLPEKNVKADGSGNYPPPIVGDWVIGMDTYVGNETIILNGNLIITNTGGLTLNNVTLLMNCTFDGQYHIEVQSGGWLNFTNESNITAYNVDYNYYMKVNSGTYFSMENSSVSYVGFEWGTNGDRMGLWINTDDSMIKNSTITSLGPVIPITPVIAPKIP